MRNLYRTNSFKAICNNCGLSVPAGEGVLFVEKGNEINFERTLNPKWVVQHKRGKCKNAIRKNSSNN